MAIIDWDCKIYGLDKIMKLLEQNNFKCFSWKTADMELRRFRNEGAIWYFN